MIPAPQTLSMRKNILLLISVSLVCLLILEGAVRLAGHTTEDGQFVLGTEIQPYALPGTADSEQINKYLEAETPYLSYDSWLGWTITPEAKSENGLYESNKDGIRSPNEYRMKKTGAFRIALFGDSFIHGDDVTHEESLAGHLEQELEQANQRVEVLNFGVPGYGIDQAFLRWQTQGVQYKPDMLIIGFQPENCLRNTNVHRAFYTKGVSSIPFTKPRFIDRNEHLELVNVPTPIPTDVPGFIRDFPDTILAEFEGFFEPKQYAPSLLTKSKLCGIAKTAINRIQEDQHYTNRYEAGSETMNLCSDLLNAFANDAVLNETPYAFLHIPQQWMMERLSDGEELPYEELRSGLMMDHPYIETVSALNSVSTRDGIESVYIPHLSPEANQSVAKAIATHLDENGILNVYEK